MRLPLEQRDRFDVRRVRKHVHHAARDEFESVLLHERAGIARQRARVARYVNHAPRRFARQIFQHRGGARARRIKQDFLVVAGRPRRAALIGGQIRSSELGIIDAVRERIRPSPRDKPGIAFDADDDTRSPRDRRSGVLHDQLRASYAL